MTPVLLQQFRLFYDTDAGPPSAGRQTDRRLAGAKPIGVVLWAVSPEASKRNVSEEVEQNLARGTTKLRPQDWKSGAQPSSSSGAVGQGRLWVVEVIAPFGGAEEMVKDLKANVFPSQNVKFLVLGRDGNKELLVI